MYTDIVIPNNNEEQFIKIAETLSYKNLCFLYSIEKFPEEKQFDKTTRLNVISAVFLNKKEFSAKILFKAKKLSNLIIYETDDDTREVIENLKPDGIVNLEKISKKDTLKQRSSGLNNVLANIMKKDKVLQVFSLQDIKNNNDEQHLGRVMQNIFLAQKHKIDCIIASFATHPYQMKNPKDIVSFFVTLGMNEAAAKKSLMNAYHKWRWNKEKTEGIVIAQGIEVVG